MCTSLNYIKDTLESYFIQMRLRCIDKQGSHKCICILYIVLDRKAQTSYITIIYVSLCVCVCAYVVNAMNVFSHDDREHTFEVGKKWFHLTVAVCTVH